jgi:ribosome-binding protein aMBF1 (putative translation factor)
MDRDEALRQIDVAQQELDALKNSTDNARAQLRDAVRRAHREAGISRPELARYVHKHRNTIRLWCA